MTDDPSQPPPLPPSAQQGMLAPFLSLVLVIFLADAVLSLADAGLLLLGVSLLTPFSSLVSFLNLLASAITYCAVGLVPRVPKRFFLPISLFAPGFLLLLPLMSIYFFSKLPGIGLGIAVAQCALGFAVLSSLQTTSGMKWKWPWIRREQLNPAAFSAPRVLLFLALNAFVLLPLLVLYFCFCAHLAVDHFSGGFLELKFGGLTAVAKTYSRSDGKTVQLIPMMHVADPGFYRELSDSFPSNSIILMEGVTDVRGRLKTKLSYKKMAQSMGLKEQRDLFAPSQGTVRPADVDVDEFSRETLELLNLASRLHSQGPNVDVLRELIAKGQNPELMNLLWKDLLTLRNAHVLREVQKALKETQSVMVPWGAAHMPGLASGIEQEGFKLVGQHEYEIANFYRMRQQRRSLKP